MHAVNCLQYLIGMFCLGVGVGIILGGLIPALFVVFLCAAGLIACGIILLVR